MPESDGPNRTSRQFRTLRTSSFGKTLERQLLFAPGARGCHLSPEDMKVFVIRQEFAVLDGIGILIIFSLRNCDDFRNQSNIRILIRRNRLHGFRCRPAGDSDQRIGFRMQILTGT